jgi:putative thiamine transport system ATP-binding protein
VAEPAEGLKLEEVRLSLAGRLLVEVTLDIAPGEIAVLTGPSGSGKSSLLSAICGTLDPAFAMTGRIDLAGLRIDALPPERRGIGILFQDDLLFPHLSVGGNLAFGLKPSVKGRVARSAVIEEALASAGLSGLADRDPATLSGGQRARISLLRVLLSEPRALLLDEPFSKLDTELRSRFRAFVFEELRRRRLPALLATHDHADADAAGGKLVEIDSSKDAGAISR